VTENDRILSGCGGRHTSRAPSRTVVGKPRFDARVFLELGAIVVVDGKSAAVGANEGLFRLRCRNAPDEKG
jgi:hypothetical protein